MQKFEKHGNTVYARCSAIALVFAPEQSNVIVQVSSDANIIYYCKKYLNWKMIHGSMLCDGIDEQGNAILNCGTEKIKLPCALFDVVGIPIDEGSHLFNIYLMQFHGKKFIDKNTGLIYEICETEDDEFCVEVTSDGRKYEIGVHRISIRDFQNNSSLDLMELNNQ